MDETGLGPGSPAQFVGVDSPGTLPAVGEPIGIGADATSGSQSAQASRRWRTVWRIHFYAGMLALPMLVLLALTGLIILYTEPIDNAFGANLRRVVPAGEVVSLDIQRAAVEAAFPDLEVSGVTTPRGAGRATRFTMATEEERFRDVFVNPYSGEVLGSAAQGSGIVGLANRLHGTLNNDSIKVPLPMITGILGDGPAFASIPVGEIGVEIFACWGLVLAATGIFLWWPRRAGTGKPLFLPSLSRFRKGGRARWRDLHAVPGIVFAGVLIFFVTTGLPWSAYWGDNWAAASSDITPAPAFDEPASTLARTGDLDRFGNRIDWAVRDVPVPASDPIAGPSDPSGGLGHPAHPDHAPGDAGPGGQSTASPSTVVAPGPPATLGLQQIAEIARIENMQSGYSIALPVDSIEDPAGPVYGSFVLADPWPARLDSSAYVYVDQFSGKTLARTSPFESGTLSMATSFGINTHMGTQFGLVNRIVMTGGALLLLWMAFTAVVMWWKRRPKGRAGMPRRPADVALPRVLKWSAVGMGLVYPLWALSALAMVGVDRFVIRRVDRLRNTFGMR